MRKIKTFSQKRMQMVEKRSRELYSLAAL